MKFNCPFCGVELEADAAPGDVGDCPNCGREFNVPGGKRRIVVRGNVKSRHQLASAPYQTAQTKKVSGRKHKPKIIVFCVLAAIALVAFLVVRAETREGQRQFERKIELLREEMDETERMADATEEDRLRRMGASDEEWRRFRERQRERRRDRREEERHRELMRELRKSR